MRKRWRYGPLRSPAAALATHRCCRTCSARSHQTRSSAALQLMEPTTRVNATMRLRPAAPTRSYRRARMQRCGSPIHQGHRHATKRLRSSKYLGRVLWRSLTGYNRRSRGETKMHCVKLLGQRLAARDFDRQVAEIQIRAAILNGFTALGIPRTVAVG